LFAVGFGVNVNDSVLNVLADSTGAWYSTAWNPSLLVDLYQSVTSWLTSDGRCWILYEATCLDGEQRPVELVVRDTCGGVARATQSYTAPLDLSLPSISLQLGRHRTWEFQQFIIPMTLESSTLGDSLPPFHCTVLFMDAMMRFDTLFTPKDSPLNGASIKATRVPGGVELRSVTPVRLTGHALPGVLANLSFTVLMAPSRDTLRLPLVFSTWSFDTGCYRSIRINGEVLIAPPRRTSVTSFPSDISLSVYPDPNPGRFTARLHLESPQSITMRVRNVLGQIVYETTRHESTGEHTFPIDLGSVPSGVYVLETTANTRMITKQIAVVR
jgi:hypothetical protein